MMNSLCRTMVVVGILFGWAGLNLLSAGDVDRSSQWQQINEALAQQDRHAAIDALAALERDATRRQEWDHAALAFAQRTELDALEKRTAPGAAVIALMDAAARAPLPMQAVLEVLAARGFRAYADQAFADPQAVAKHAAGAEGSDDNVASWCTERMLNEIEQCYQRALAFEAVLKKIPVGMYGALFDAGTVPDALRPSLFDAVAHDLLSFYAWVLREGLDDTETVTLEPDGPALQDATGFIFVIPEEAARRSRVLRALRLWQVLLNFHESDEDPAAYADADLSRLQFCYPLVAGGKKEERYAAALDRFAHKWRTHELLSRALSLRAQLAFDAEDAALARVIAQKGAAAYPESIGAAQCRNLIARIETPSLAISSERVWCAPWPQIEVSYKNLTQLHFRAVRVSFEEACVPRVAQSQNVPAAGNWLSRRPVKQWGMALPPAGDYRIRRHHVSVPQELPAGLYALFVSPEAAFEAGGAPIQWALFRVSRLALVIDQKPDLIQGYVLTAREGEPVPSARVTVWRRFAEGGYMREQAMATGEDGGFSVRGDHAGDMMILAERQGEAAQTWAPVWKGNAHARFEAPASRVAFVTDRAVYRPGEVLRFKGFFWKDDPVLRRGYAAAGSRVKVTGTDAAGRRFFMREILCTPFGSCSDELTLPGDTPAGPLTLAAEGAGEVVVKVVADMVAAPFSAHMFTVAADVKDAKVRNGLAVLPVELGETAWRAEFAADAWQTSTQPVRFEVSAQEQDGAPVATSGDLQVVQLKQPECVKRPPLPFADGTFDGQNHVSEAGDALDAWPESHELVRERIRTGTDGVASGSVPLPAGAYRLVFETRDPAGQRVTARRNVRVIDADSRRLPVREPCYFEAESWRVQPGCVFCAVWGSGYMRASALVLAESDGLERFRLRTDPDVTQQRIEWPIDNPMLGGVRVRLLCVKENRAYAPSRLLEVPALNRRLNVAIDGKPLNVAPGMSAVCAVKVTDSDGKGCEAELLAQLILAEDGGASVSGDGFMGFRRALETNSVFRLQNHATLLTHLRGGWKVEREADEWCYRSWSGRVGREKESGSAMSFGGKPVPKQHVVGAISPAGLRGAVASEPRLFIPHVPCDGEGAARVTFMMPDDPERWRLRLTAHDARLRSGCLEVPLAASSASGTHSGSSASSGSAVIGWRPGVPQAGASRNERCSSILGKGREERSTFNSEVVPVTGMFIER